MLNIILIFVNDQTESTNFHSNNNHDKSFQHNVLLNFLCEN